MNTPTIILTADIVLLRPGAGELPEILFIKRSKSPYAGMYALPGGKVIPGRETAGQTAHRELSEETGIRGVQLEQLHTYSDPWRDPHGHFVSVVYVGVLAEGEGEDIQAGDDVAEVCWFEISNLPELAFDHVRVAADALKFIAARGDLL